MLGQINEWFFHDLAGLQPDADRPGFKHVILRPRPCGDVTRVDATYAGPYGPIAVAWRTTPTVFELTTTIPANSTATATLPGRPDPIDLPAGTHRLTAPAA